MNFEKKKKEEKRRRMILYYREYSSIKKYLANAKWIDFLYNVICDAFVFRTA